MLPPRPLTAPLKQATLVSKIPKYTSSESGLSPLLMAADDTRLSWLLCTIWCEVTGEAGLPQETRLHLVILTGVSQAEGAVVLLAFDSLLFWLFGGPLPSSEMNSHMETFFYL